MAFQKKSKRVQPLKPKDKELSKNVTPLSLEDAVLTFDGHKTYFKRLRYKGCPKLNHAGKAIGEFPEATVLELMHRDAFVREIHNILSKCSDKARTGHNHFMRLISYVSALDQDGRNTDFSEENVLWYINFLQEKVLKNEIKVSTYSEFKGSIIYFLRQLNCHSLIRKIPPAKGVAESVTPHPTLSDDDLIKIAKKLMHSYKLFASHVISGTELSICPLFDEEELKNHGLSEEQIDRLRFNAKRRITHANWQNQLSRLALMIVALWTGANLGPLCQLKRHDAVFRNGDGDNYRFNSVKARALYAEQELGFGFVKRTKQFIENWLLVSEKFSADENSPLFPIYERGGAIISTKGYLNPQIPINKALKYHGYPNITTSTFRKTRSNIMMRAYNDVFKVAEANNSSVETVAKDYLHGVPEHHQMRLAGAFSAQQKISSGIEKSTAIEESILTFKDPFTKDEWKKKNNRSATKTPTGFRCTDPFGKKAASSLKAYDGFSGASHGACVDFLGCFECSNHALVAETDDIWLMLSFKDSILETMSRPSFNSSPGERFEKISRAVDSILERYKKTDQAAFREAVSLNNAKPHPLYDSAASIDDLLELYT
jgi:hypothetical protein